MDETTGPECLPRAGIQGLPRYLWRHVLLGASGRSEVEVDFILVRGAELIAVEVKSGSTFMDAWCRGLRAIAPLPGMRRRIVVYPRGPVMRTKDGIDAVPFQRFAGELAANAVWT